MGDLSQIAGDSEQVGGSGAKSGGSMKITLYKLYNNLTKFMVKSSMGRNGGSGISHTRTDKSRPV